MSIKQAYQTDDRQATKERLLVAAESLIADHGFQAATLRQITAAAGVNLAAANYHFHSKEALLEAVIDRKMGPANVRRLALLDELEASCSPGGPSVERVVQAFIQPILEIRAAGMEIGNFPRLMARLASEHDDRAMSIMSKRMAGVLGRFLPALGRALGVQDPGELAWHFHLSMGVMAYGLMGSEFVRRIAGLGRTEDSAETHLKRLTSYIAGGMRALAEMETRR